MYQVKKSSDFYVKLLGFFVKLIFYVMVHAKNFLSFNFLVSLNSKEIYKKSKENISKVLKKQALL